jgi:hypothetical protein
LPKRSRENLALQKESLNTALRIAKLDPDAVINWLPPEHETGSYLDGIQTGTVREGLMISADAEVFPGYEFVARDVRTATKTFSNRRTRLRVTVADRQPLEEQTGADLIYFNETYNSFVIVQYKAMRRESGGFVSPFIYRPDKQLEKEITRMEAVNDVISEITSPDTLPAYRLNSDPFYLKLCPNITLNLDERSLFKGMYFPLSYWRLLLKDPCTEGPRGGRIVTYDNAGRKFNSTEFIQLVSSGFIGSRLYQSDFIRSLIQKVLSENKVVTLAVETAATPGMDWVMLDDEEDTEEGPMLS